MLLLIPLGKVIARQDQLVWHCEVRGVDSVRSSYRLAL